MNKSGKIKIFSFISLDWFTARTDGDIDWLLEYPRPGVGKYGLPNFCNSVDCVVINGIYYATLQAYDLWPLRNIQHHVINVRHGIGIKETVDTIRGKTDGDVWLVGDHEILSMFMEQCLVDEIILNIIPITLGNGHSLFNRNHVEQQWKLEHSESYDNGVVQMKYTVSRSETL